MTGRTSAEPRSKGLLTPRPDAPVTIGRHAPSPDAEAFVRHYWIPRWSLPAGATVRQEVLEYPTANLVVEPLPVGPEGLLYRAHRGLGVQTLSGEGWGFGVLLRPGVARGWAGASVRTLPSATPLTRLPGFPEAAEVAARIAGRMAAGDDEGAIAAFEAGIAALPRPDADAELVDAIVAAVETDRALRRVEQLADRFGLGVRHLQRLVAGHIGFGPKWLIQRYRLQEAAAALRSDDPPALAALAAELGYADQAHFSREFRAVVGATPGAYAAAQRVQRNA